MPLIGYLWSWGDGTTDNIEYTSHTYTAAAHYNVCLTVTDANGCANTYCENDSLYRTTQNSNIVAQVNVVGNGTTGINKAPVNRSTIYPNPANNQLNINFASAVNKVSKKYTH
jgi:microbial collagenase